MNTFHFVELVISLSFQISLIIGATWGINLLVQDERTRSRVWTGCYTTILLLVIAAVTLPHPRFLHPFRNFSNQSLITLAEVEQQGGKLMFVLWLTGAVAAIGLTSLRFWATHRFISRCQRLDEHSKQGKLLYAVLLDSTGQLGEFKIDNRRMEIRISSRITTPFCWQFHKPYIVLPDYLIGFEPRSVLHVVRHELEHLQTGHPLQVFLQKLTGAVFWFHPFVWWARSQSDLNREFACDEAAIQSKEEIVHYLRTLLAIVEYTTAQQETFTTSLHFIRGKKAIAKRAERLVALASDRTKKQLSSLSATGAFVALIFTSVLVFFLWCPLNVLASTRSSWSPWPKWSANVLHSIGISARDFEVFDQRNELKELIEHSSDDITPAD